MKKAMVAMAHELQNLKHTQGGKQQEDDDNADTHPCHSRSNDTPSLKVSPAPPFVSGLPMQRDLLRLKGTDDNHPYGHNLEEGLAERIAEEV